MKALNLAALSCIVLGVGGCLPAYTIPTDKPKAQFMLAAENDSRGTTLRNIWTRVFKNEECEKSDYGMNAGTKILTDGDMMTNPVEILAGATFVFSTTYMDARGGQNRKCTITGSFVPQPNRTYKGVLMVNSEVTACKLGIYDMTSGKEEQIPFSMPRNICEDDFKTGRLNGQPLWINWTIRVNRY